jgi:hypothetical protein
MSSFQRVLVYEKWGGLGMVKNEGAGACLEKSIFFT